VLVPVPERFPGFIVHVPVAGKPLNATLPVPTLQVGWVIVPTVGAIGEEGAAVIITSAGPEEVQPEALVTVKL
jgi:hypothetical protein